MEEAVRDYYGSRVQRTEDLSYSACCVADYDPAQLSHLTEEVLERRYGCGSPLPELLEDLTVLDLGCGAGADAFVASRLVGPSGRVIGVDMTPEQLEVARRNVAPVTANLGYAEPNVAFLDGHIEEIPAEDASVDVVISNCVINLSTDKRAVFAEINRVLRPGGEFYISDIVADRRVPARLQADELLWSECLTGAAYEEDLRRITTEAGFPDTRVVSRRRLDEVIEGVRFDAIVLRGFRLDLEDACEDFGQVAVYGGTIPGHPDRLVFDDHHVFPAGDAVRICGNTSDMLTGSRYAEHFRVSPPLGHLGRFDCSTPAEAVEPDTADGSPAGACC